MLSGNIEKKFNELESAVALSHLSIYATYQRTVYIASKNGVEQKKLVDFGKIDEQEKLIRKVFEQPCVNVVATFKTDEIVFANEFGQIPPMLDDFCEIFGGKVKVVDSKETLKFFNEIRRRRAVIAKDKFAVVCARSLDEIGTMVRIMNKSAFVLTKTSDKFVSIPKWISNGENFFFKRSYSKVNQEREWSLETKGIDITKVAKKNLAKKNCKEDDLKNTIVNVAKRMYADNSTQGTWGNVAVRINDEELYCTPKAIGYNLLTPTDIVKLNFVTMKQLSGGVATSEKGIHCRIMREHPDAFCSIHAHPTFCSIFAARNAILKVEGEATKILGEKVYCSKHALPMSKKLANNTVDSMRGGKAVFMGNHGVAVYGTSVEDVFNVLNTLEEECKKQILKIK